MRHVSKKFALGRISFACLLHCVLSKFESFFKLFAAFLLFAIKPRSVSDKNNIKSWINRVKIKLLVKNFAFDEAGYIDFVNRIFLSSEGDSVLRKRIGHRVNLFFGAVQNRNDFFVNVRAESFMQEFWQNAAFLQVLADRNMITTYCHVSYHFKLSR